METWLRGASAVRGGFNLFLPLSLDRPRATSTIFLFLFDHSVCIDVWYTYTAVARRIGGESQHVQIKLVHCWPILTRNPRRIQAHILHISYGAPVHTPFFVELATVFPGKKNTPTEEYIAAAIQDENGRKTTQPFSTSTFEYENENKSGKARHENEHELRNIENFKNKLIRAELCRTRSVYENF